MSADSVAARLGSRFARYGLPALLATLGVCFVLLHTWHWEKAPQFRWWVDHISTYTSSAPGRAFGTACMLTLGIIYLGVAASFPKRLPPSRTGTLAVQALTLAGGLLFLVALYPAPYKEPTSTPEKGWFRQKIEEIVPCLSGWFPSGFFLQAL